MEKPPEQLPRIGRDPLTPSSEQASETGKTTRQRTTSGEIPDVAVRTDPRSERKPLIIARLTDQAKSQIRQGQLEHAFVTTERALRIDSRDPSLWSMLAEIQLKRGNIHQAEQLARKSNLFAEWDRRLRSKNWRIIAEALKRKGATSESEDALRRAEEFDD